MKYLAYYDVPENKEQNRDVALAAVNKITYVCDALNRLGKTVQIVSASPTKGTKRCKGKRIRVSEKTELKLFSSFGRGSLPAKMADRLFLKAKLFLYLLFAIKRDETVLVYHSVAYAGMVLLLKKLRKFRLILEVEEIYSDVNGLRKDRKKEYNVFSAADAYIFSTELLNKKINPQKKPHVILYGTYLAEPDRKCRFEDPGAQEKIHCVYAGTFDPRKGGCLMAVNAARYLPEQYHIHILGFGPAEDTRNVQNAIEEVKKSGGCGISYDGCLKGEEYIRFLQSCQIGLSTQNPDAAFNDTSFPSKILSYMANGLQVVTVRIPVVGESTIDPWVNYYIKPNPKQVAEAIMKTQKHTNCDGRKILSELDKGFVRDIGKIISDY